MLFSTAARMPPLPTASFFFPTSTPSTPTTPSPEKKNTNEQKTLAALLALLDAVLPRVPEAVLVSRFAGAARILSAAVRATTTTAAAGEDNNNNDASSVSSASAARHAVAALATAAAVEASSKPGADEVEALVDAKVESAFDRLANMLAERMSAPTVHETAVVEAPKKDEAPASVKKQKKKRTFAERYMGIGEEDE